MLRLLTALEACLEVIWLRIIVRVHHLGDLVIAELLDRPLVVLIVRVINFSFLRWIHEVWRKFRPIDGLLLVFGLRFVLILVLPKQAALLSAESDSFSPVRGAIVPITAHVDVFVIIHTVFRLGVLRRAAAATWLLDHWLRVGFLLFGVIGLATLLVLASRLPRLLRVPALLLAHGGPSIATGDGDAKVVGLDGVLRALFVRINEVLAVVHLPLGAVAASRQFLRLLVGLGLLLNRRD